MKVITQLIKHFWERGALANSEVHYLVQNGFVRAHDLPGYAALPEPEAETQFTTIVEPPSELETLEEQLASSSSHRRSCRPAAKRKVLRIKDICALVTNEFERRQHDLASVRALGNRFRECDDWSRAAASMRQIDEKKFCDELTIGLSTGEVLLGDLWQASDPEPFHELLRDDEIRGSAAHAYLALLVAHDPGELGKYGWVLQHESMRNLLNLRVLHLRLLHSQRQMFGRRLGPLTQALQRNCDDVQFWSLVILYNAMRPAGPENGPRYGVEYGPLPLPVFDVWRQAWTAALLMDQSPVKSLLVSCYGGSTLPDDDDACRLALMCPVGWHAPSS